ncbi:DUF302 domain-containing protein [Carnobacterium pleistocenium]|uniref:DUF302 domain-containing protein n=1 Tax=Carnobacterium pleistocenium TaxID=181073 RepID=UPI00055592D3|nr:DUF302 domain-containing protein [Carnobacterium pleistocenium]
MDIVYEKRTDKSLEEAIQALEENLKENNFGILWKLNFKDKLAEKGLELKDDFVVLEVCNPKQAKEVLERNVHVGYVLPCKMVVRTAGNKTYMGMTSPEKLIGLFDESELSIIAESVETILKKSITSSI